MKKTITTWLLGWMPVLLLTAQTGLSSRISTTVVVGNGDMKSKGDVFVSPGAKLRNGGTVTLEQSLKLEAGASSAGLMENKETGVLNLKNGVVFYSNDASDGMLANHGSVNIDESAPESVKLVKAFTDENSYSKYYYLSFPFDVNEIKDLTTDPIVTLNVNSEFLLKKYNGFQRATDGNKLAWEPTSTIHADTAYAFMLSNKRANHTVEFSASDKITSPYLDSDSDAGKTMNIPYHFIELLKDSFACTGWNCIGNPYTSTFHVSHNSTNFRGEVYFLNTQGGNYECAILSNSGTESTFSNDSYLPIPPFTTIFTHGSKDSPETFKFDKSGISNDFSTLRSAKRNNRFTLKIESDANAYSDKTLILIGEDFSAGYKPLEDAFKIYTSNTVVPCLWSLSSDNNDLMINQIPDPGAEAIRLGCQTGKKGNYTISLNDDQMDDYEWIWLKDKKTAIETNLRASSYTFSVARDGEEMHTDRFSLSFLRSSTSLENTVGNIQPLIYGSDGVIHVEGIEPGDRITICDLTGRLVASAVSRGDAYLSDTMASGIYIVKVEGSILTTTKVKN